ncbi:MAG: adenylate/guanylate cyclase domain-containing protein [Acidimicrobiia bacterium]
MEPTTGYAELGDQRIAYQILGDGPIDVVYTFGFVGSIDVEWEDPSVRLFFQQIARYARVIRFDRRGTGASDPIALDALPPWESFADEIEAVMDSVGSDQAAVIAGGPAGPVGLLFAATRPERVRALILYQTSVRYLEDDDYPIGIPRQQLNEYQARVREGWGTGEVLDLMFPSRAGDERFRTWYAKLERSISSPGAIQKYMEAEAEIDARALLPTITVPTLVIHRTDSEVSPLAWGRYIADHIEGARLVELPGGDVAPYWDHPELTLDATEEFLTGIRREAPKDRQLATVLFTDVVDSTRKAEELGDRRCRVLIDLHDSTARDLVHDHAGHLVRTTGDGILATFDGPGRAIRGATVLQDELAKADLQIRTGIHAGEIEILDNDVAGIAVHLAARIMAAAGAGEIMVSRTVRDLVVGSGISFKDRGSYTLKGIEGEWQLYLVIQPGAVT